MGPKRVQKTFHGGKGTPPLSWALWALCGPMLRCNLVCARILVRVLVRVLVHRELVELRLVSQTVS